MIRRTFLKLVGAFAAAVALPVQLPRAEEMERVQYAETVTREWDESLTMPINVKAELDAKIETAIATAGCPEMSREYLWLPFDRNRFERSDALATKAYGAVKVFVEEPRRLHDARMKAEIAAGGWAVSLVASKEINRAPKGMRPEFFDFRLNGKTDRYIRMVSA